MQGWYICRFQGVLYLNQDHWPSCTIKILASAIHQHSIWRVWEGRRWKMRPGWIMNCSNVWFYEQGHLARFKSTCSCSNLPDVFFCLFQIRHNIRPYFLVSDAYKRIYDVITWAGTQVAISYTVVPFVLLAVGPSLKFYRYVCFRFDCWQQYNISVSCIAESCKMVIL